MPALKQVQTDSDYHKQTALNDIKKLNSQLKELPGFCRDFFRGIEQTTTTKTRIGYASDLRTFFRFLFSTNPEFSDFFPVSDISESVSCKNRDSELKRFRTGSVKTDRY